MLWKIRHICKKNWQIRVFDKKRKKLRILWKLGHLCFIVNCDSNWKIAIEKVWLGLFEDIILFILLRIFFRSLIFCWKNLVK